MASPLLERRPEGLYCPLADVWIDPWRKVERAIVTHAHSDHARWGMGHYLASAEGEGVLRERVGKDASIETLAYCETKRLGEVTVSLHPAGHILGSAQVRLEHQGYVAVVSGDYKTEPDPTCSPFEPVRCHLFVSECTFGLPIYRWPAEQTVMAEVNAWWRANQARQRASVIYAYSLGKAQRLLAGLDPAIGPIRVHGAVARHLPAYAAAGIELPPAPKATDDNRDEAKGCGMVIAPPSTAGSAWLRKFGERASAFASGWMLVRGTRRRRAVDRGFILSDHADWEGLLSAIAATRCETVWATHGYAETFARYLREERQLEAIPIDTRFTGEAADDDAEA